MFNIPEIYPQTPKCLVVGSKEQQEQLCQLMTSYYKNQTFNLTEIQTLTIGTMDTIFIDSIDHYGDIDIDIQISIILIIFICSETDNINQIEDQLQALFQKTKFKTPCIILAQNQLQIDYITGKSQYQKILYTQQNFKKVYDTIFDISISTCTETINQFKQLEQQVKQDKDIQLSKRTLCEVYFDQLKFYGMLILLTKPYIIKQQIHEQMKNTKLSFFPTLIYELEYNGKHYQQLVQNYQYKKVLLDASKNYLQILFNLQNELTEVFQIGYSMDMIARLTSVVRMYGEILVPHYQNHIQQKLSKILLNDNVEQKVERSLSEPNMQHLSNMDFKSIKNSTVDNLKPNLNVFYVFREIQSMFTDQLHGNTQSAIDCEISSKQQLIDKCQDYELIQTLQNQIKTLKEFQNLPENQFFLLYFRISVILNQIYLTCLAYAPALLNIYKNVQNINDKKFKQQIQAIMQNTDEEKEEAFQFDYQSSLYLFNKLIPLDFENDDVDLTTVQNVPDIFYKLLNKFMFHKQHLEKSTKNTIFNTQSILSEIGRFDPQRTLRFYFLVSSYFNDEVNLITQCDFVYNQAIQLFSLIQHNNQKWIKFNSEQQIKEYILSDITINHVTLNYLNLILDEPDDQINIIFSNLENTGVIFAPVLYLINIMCCRTLRICNNLFSDNHGSKYQDKINYQLYKLYSQRLLTLKGENYDQNNKMIFQKVNTLFKQLFQNFTVENHKESILLVQYHIKLLLQINDQDETLKQQEQLFYYYIHNQLLITQFQFRQDYCNQLTECNTLLLKLINCTVQQKETNNILITLNPQLSGYYKIMQSVQLFSKQDLQFELCVECKNLLTNQNSLKIDITIQTNKQQEDEYQCYDLQIDAVEMESNKYKYCFDLSGKLDINLNYDVQITKISFTEQVSIGKDINIVVNQDYSQCLLDYKQLQQQYISQSQKIIQQQPQLKASFTSKFNQIKINIIKQEQLFSGVENVITFQIEDLNNCNLEQMRLKITFLNQQVNTKCYIKYNDTLSDITQNSTNIEVTSLQKNQQLKFILSSGSETTIDVFVKIFCNSSSNNNQYNIQEFSFTLKNPFPSIIQQYLYNQDFNQIPENIQITTSIISAIQIDDIELIQQQPYDYLNFNIIGDNYQKTFQNDVEFKIVQNAQFLLNNQQFLEANFPKFSFLSKKLNFKHLYQKEQFAPFYGDQSNLQIKFKYKNQPGLFEMGWTNQFELLQKSNINLSQSNANDDFQSVYANLEFSQSGSVNQPHSVKITLFSQNCQQIKINVKALQQNVILMQTVEQVVQLLPFQQFTTQFRYICLATGIQDICCVDVMNEQFSVKKFVNKVLIV